MVCKLALDSVGFLLIILAAAKETNALSCLVCESIDGSNPECETAGVNGEPSSAVLQSNCKSTIGSIDGKTQMKATACMVLMGEYRDQATKTMKSIISRKCTAGILPIASADSVNCNRFDSEGHIPAANREYITGCAEACFEDKCNGKPMSDLVGRFKPKIMEYVEKARRNDPKNPVRFPSVFAVEETQRLMERTGAAEKSVAANRFDQQKFWIIIGSIVLFHLV